MKLLISVLFLSTATLSNAFQVPRGFAELKEIVEHVIEHVPFSVPAKSTTETSGENSGAERRDFKLKIYEAGTLRFCEAQDVCETTPGVYQASGYAALTSTEHMWFWFFAARENPDTAPLAIWINGGPGSSSMTSLFEGNGPCHLTADKLNVTHNPFSWNNRVNMLYIDQPIGTGFSHGNILVGRTSEAADDMWKFLQIFFSHPNFQKYQERELGMWSESYGGHYAPYFVSHFLKMNDKIRSGKLEGKPINVKVLGIGNGLTDNLHHYVGYLEYARSNPYRPLANATFVEKIKRKFFEYGGCKAQIKACQLTRMDSICTSANALCTEYVWGPLAQLALSEGDPYFVKDPDSRHKLPEIPFLESVKGQIGSEIPWAPVNSDVVSNFDITGDFMKICSPELQYAINAGIRTVLYNGDADYVVNYFGIESMLRNLRTKNRKRIVEHRFLDYVVGNEHAGRYQSEGNLHYVRVFGAGHAVQNYAYKSLGRGQVAEQMFNQVMFGLPLSGVGLERKGGSREQTGEGAKLDL